METLTLPLPPAEAALRRPLRPLELIGNTPMLDLSGLLGAVGERDIGKAAEEMSKELRSSLGPIVAMLPMPMTEASIESIESTPTGYKAVLHLVGEGDTLRLETRWKDRDGEPTLVEASHVSRTERAAAEADADADALEGESAGVEA